MPATRRPARRPALRVEALEDRRTPAINVAVVGLGTGGPDAGFVATVNQLNDDTHFDFTATLVTAAQVDTAAELNAYDAVVIGNNGTQAGDPFDNLAFTTALRTWVEAGGGVVITGPGVWGATPVSGGYVPNIDAIIPVNVAGGAGGIGGSVNVTAAAHPVTTGVATFPVAANVEYPIGGIDAGATTLAVTNTNMPAVVAGPVGAGRGVFLGPLYSMVNVNATTELRTGHADRLLEQAVAWARKNYAPTAVTLTGPGVAENEPVGTLAAKLLAADPNPGDKVTFQLVDGPGAADNDQFYLANATNLYANRPFDFEARSAYSVRVRATDDRGLSVEQAVTIQVRDAPEAPTALTLSNAAVNENQPAGTVVGSFTATDPDAGDTFAYQLVDGADGPGDNAFFALGNNVLKTAAAFDYESRAFYTVRARATDSTGRAVERVFTVTVEDLTGAADNTPPVLTGVPVSAAVTEGDTLTFAAGVTDPDGGQAHAFSLVGAPAGATIEKDTGAFAWATTEADGPASYTFVVRVTDGFATAEQLVTVVVREANAEPVLDGVPADVTTVRGRAAAFTATAADPDALNGLGNALTFSLVGAPAGATIHPDTGAFRWVPGGDVEPGDYRFQVRVADDGVPAAVALRPVELTVADAAVVNGDLLVGGTGGNDVITVNPTRDKLGLVVTMNREVLGTFPLSAVAGRVVAHALGGNDKVTVNARVAVGADLYGGSGNDQLTGGAGSDVLVGGAGNDRLAGGLGANVLLGGLGADRLAGGKGDDLLIGGWTTYDTDPTGLAAIRAEWASGSPYADRVAHLTGSAGGLNGGSVVVPGEVFDDGLKDVLVGGLGGDWFVVSGPDALDLKAGEQKLTV